jgi:hypothetical protein
MNRKLKPVAILFIILAMGWNIAGFTRSVFNLPPLEHNDLVGWEKQWLPLGLELALRSYSIGDIGFVTAATLRGQPPSELDQIRRLQLSYVAIPLNPVMGRLDTPYVIGEFTDGRPPQAPPHLIPILESGNMVLFKNTGN